MNALSISQSQVLRVLAATARFTWEVVRLPLIAVLTLLEPVVRFVCILAMMLGIFTAVVFEVSAVGPTFPFLGMLAASLGLVLALMAYYALLSMLLR